MEQVDHMEEFKKHLSAKDMSRRTAAQYRQYVAAFHDFIGTDTDLLTVTEDDLTDYVIHLREQKISKSTIKRYFSGLNSYYKFLARKKYIPANPVPDFRDEYLHSYKNPYTAQRRQIISIQQAAALVQSILDPRERSVVVTLFKTGLRRHELSELDLEDVDLEKRTIRLKPTSKRTNEIVYFDKETVFVLQKYLKRREKNDINKEKAFFLNRFGERLSPVGVSRIVTKHAAARGLHNPTSDRTHLQDRFTPHCCRHWFVTHLRRRGMPDPFIEELRGDRRHDAIDQYDHIDEKELQNSYDLYIPPLGLI